MPRGNFFSTNQKHYQDLGSARHQYGISALVTQTSFCEGLSGDLARRRLFSQATQIRVQTSKTSFAAWKDLMLLPYDSWTNDSFWMRKTNKQLNLSYFSALSRCFSFSCIFCEFVSHLKVFSLCWEVSRLKARRSNRCNGQIFLPFHQKNFFLSCV